jgi:hypothetical protein
MTFWNLDNIRASRLTHTCTRVGGTALSGTIVASDTKALIVFNDAQIDLSLADRISAVCDWRDGLTKATQGHWTFVGEWSNAPTDCAGGHTGAAYTVISRAS